MDTKLPAKPSPRIDTINRGFWENCRKGVLSIQTCDDCSHRHYPGTPVCPNCLSSKQSWQPVSGQGTLLSWVRFHRAYWDSFRDDLPYAVCLVGLAEGPMMISNLVDADPETLPIGSALQVAFEQVDETLTLPKFKPLKT